MTAAELRRKRAELRANGINLRQYCDERGIDYQAAREVLTGKAKAHRGKRHLAAVALGLKPNPASLQMAA